MYFYKVILKYDAAVTNFKYQISCQPAAILDFNFSDLKYDKDIKLILLILKMYSFT